MNIFGWGLQIILSGIFIFQSLLKFNPALKRNWVVTELFGWSNEVPNRLLMSISLLEAIAAAGLILPGLFGKYPYLTIYSAIALMIAMVAAGIFHITRKEYTLLVINIMIFWMASLVVVIRGLLLPL